MALNKVTYVDGETVITAENLNDIQDAIIDLEQGGGSGVDYSSLTNKPSINSVTLDGNKTAAQLGLSKQVVEVTVSNTGTVTQALDAGKVYHFTGDLVALTITFNAAAAGTLAQYHFDFNCGSAAVPLTMPASVIMPDGFTTDVNMHYEVDVLNNYAVIANWEAST